LRDKFSTEQWIAAPVEQVFAFFADPENLPRLMPRWQRAHIQQARLVPPPQQAECADTPRGLAAGEGSEMTIRFRPFPLSPIQLSWRARIAEFTWNDHFCDEQLSGPFAYWLHCHHVSPEVRNGARGTLVQDHVEYELPFGFLGEAGNRVFGRRQIASIFRYRQTTLKKIFDELCAPTVDPIGFHTHIDRR
jgi:ligand-binding SRPBCC domain-containing protein